MLPPEMSIPSALVIHTFRDSMTRPTRSLSTLRSARSPSPHARLASGWWPTLAGRRSLLLERRTGFHREVSAFSSTSQLPPHPGFAWRTDTVCRRAFFSTVHPLANRLLETHACSLPRKEETAAATPSLSPAKPVSRRRGFLSESRSAPGGVSEGVRSFDRRVRR